ncbi:DsbE family thiol:disulfide interchange protein [Actibacterium pelagium]|uniref:Thiol:disulfide interchange protein n=1 Tax=Actibacterium pelagium TaxID=2029103 RepID=A0A917AB21_9RHOB|nr:DsbE family thiol:disulfide interchange protein [Actibacterium pelagium]GGE40214.1 thiol:disulfide interchange protein [Actibacterium pelagium]
MAKRKISVLVFLPPLIFAGLVAVFLLGMHRDDPDALPSTMEGRQAPPLALTEFEGEVVTDADLKTPGVKLVNYWASWCGPCRAEHPQLMTLAEEGIAIYGINYKDDPANAKGFLDELGDPYVKSGADLQGRTALNWGLYGVPETFVIDENGVVLLRFAGPITRPILDQRIRPLLK